MNFVPLIVQIALIFIIVLAEQEERRPSMFKVGEEWLALPEVFSVLDFSADNKPANENDIEGQMRLRSSRFWGRIYIDGWPQTIQYFRAHFGIEPPTGRKTFVFAEPRDACVDLTNSHLLTSDHVVLVNRGVCTFGTKAKNVQKTAAAAVIVINNEPGLDHLPGPDAHDIQFSVSSIPQPEGQLLESFYDEGPAYGGFGRKLEGYMVPINCENSGATCVPATYEDRRNVKGLIEGGVVHVHGSSLKPSDLPIEYLLAHFGTKVAHSNDTMKVVVARPAEACSSIENDVRGKVVLVRRGSCPFVKKAEEVQAAGGRVVIVGSSHSFVLRMGVEPRWKGLNTAIPVVMVSKRAYSALVAESFTGGSLSFEEQRDVNSTAWELLEKLFNGEGWPRSESYVIKRYQELLAAAEQWPDRLETIKSAFSKNYPGLAANAAAASQPTIPQPRGGSSSVSNEL